MVLVPSRHDELPKTQLDGGYLGDGHPLCSARPRRHFLLAGARYVRIIPSWPPFLLLLHHRRVYGYQPLFGLMRTSCNLLLTLDIFFGRPLHRYCRGTCPLLVSSLTMRT